VDTQTNHQNCGGSGVACSSLQVCSAGGCCTPGDPQCSCDQVLASNSALDLASLKCSATELVTFEKDGTGQCLGCLLQSGCFDIVGVGNECQDQPGGAGSTNESLCLNVLACNLGENPPATPGPALGLTVNAFCGPGQSSVACDTNPAGACAAQWEAAFPGQNGAQIQAEIGVTTFPGGVANSITTCANTNCLQCF
jgi:hypothetical protein